MRKGEAAKRQGDCGGRILAEDPVHIPAHILRFADDEEFLLGSREGHVEELLLISEYVSGIISEYPEVFGILPEALLLGRIVLLRGIEQYHDVSLFPFGSVIRQEFESVLEVRIHAREPFFAYILLLLSFSYGFDEVSLQEFHPGEDAHPVDLILPGEDHERTIRIADDGMDDLHQDLLPADPVFIIGGSGTEHVSDELIVCECLRKVAQIDVDGGDSGMIVCRRPCGNTSDVLHQMIGASDQGVRAPVVRAHMLGIDRLLSEEHVFEF